jgi:hypothetical protein
VGLKKRIKRLREKDRAIDKEALEAYYEKESTDVVWYHGNLRDDLEVGMWLYPEDEAEGGFEYVYYTPQWGLANQYTFSDDGKIYGGQVYILEPFEGMPDPEYAGTSIGEIVFVCKKALIVGIA